MSELIAGRYRLLDEAGRGAMGVVWRARDQQLDRIVAVKQLGGADQTSNLRALREARLAARLRHPHAVTVHDVVEEDGRPYLVMEYVPSRSLSDLLRDRGVLPPDRVAEIGAQLASALAAAHAEGIVHRDVTPSNVLITESGDAKIVDFGISRANGESIITGGGLIAGTPAYLAPEVASGAEADFPADVFSLGATLYHALEGAPPFGTDDNTYALLARVAHDEVTPPRQAGPLSDVLLRLLQRNPYQRPAMGEAHQLFDAVIANRPLPPPRPQPPGTRLLHVPRSRRRVTVAAGIGAILLVLGVVIGIAIAPHGGSVAGPLIRPTPTTTTAPASAGCVARYQVTQSWPGGYQVHVTVHNTRTAGLAGWEVTWQLPDGHHIAGLWDGLWNVRGSLVTVDNANYNAHLDAAASTSFGLNVSRPGDGDPQAPTVTCRAIDE